MSVCPSFCDNANARNLGVMTLFAIRLIDLFPPSYSFLVLCFLRGFSAAFFSSRSFSAICLNNVVTIRLKPRLFSRVKGHLHSSPDFFSLKLLLALSLSFLAEREREREKGRVRAFSEQKSKSYTLTFIVPYIVSSYLLYCICLPV